MPLTTEELAKVIEENPTAVDSYISQVFETITADQCGPTSKPDDMDSALEKHMLKKIKTKNKKYEPQMLELCQLCLNKRVIRYYNLAETIFRDKKIIKFKEHLNRAEALVRSFEVPVELVRTKRDDWRGANTKPSDCEMGKAINSCIESMMEAFDRDKIMKKVSKSIVELVISLIRSPNDLQQVVCKAFVASSWHSMCWEGCEALLPNLYTAMYNWMIKEHLDLEISSDEHTETINEVISSSLSGAGSPSKYGKELCQIFNYVLTKDLDGDPYTGWGMIAQTISSGYITKHYGNQRAIKEFVPGVIKMLKSDCDYMVNIASGSIACFYQDTDLLAPCADDVMEAFLSGKSDILGLVLKPLYGVEPEKILSRFDQLSEAMEDMSQSNKTYIYMLWDDVAKDKPELLLPHIDLLMDDVANSSLCNQVIMILGSVSVKYPEKFVDKIDKLMSVANKIPYAIHAIAKVVASVGQMNENQADRCIRILLDKLTTSEDTWISTIMMEIKMIARKYVTIFKKYRPEIEPFKNSQQMGVPDLAQSLINIIEGISLETLADDVEEVKDDVNILDNRVTETEQNVDRLDQTVAEQGQEIDDVKNEVTEQADRLDELEEVVDDTVLKVEEIDHKTITNAPKWSRDVSKLLNPEHEHDWRYLAIRLGFTGEDVRHWAVSPDPTMALLAEWYTVHKSSEASYAVLTALQDMGRDDAAAIVEESLQAADALVPKAAPDMSEKPPRVFISYQWDHQPEVKTLKDHLERAGFRCWLDIGQMGGGDSLFSKINDGMRAAKVVLCMCTDKYSMSENCNKEVNLANLLNKPIIPVLIEKTAWPPAGSMSMLFAQLLYIQLYNDREYTTGEQFWEDIKFAELLGQISYHTGPDEEMITDEYRNWVPQVDDLPKVVKKADAEKTKTDAKRVAPIEEGQTQDLIPQVFISYQWDKQTEIKRLYSRLTTLGFTCWLDILQMGGGDPLYSKIDKGIRNAKVGFGSV